MGTALSAKDMNNLLEKRLKEYKEDMKTDCKKCKKFREIILEKDEENSKLVNEIRNIKYQIGKIKGI